MKLRTRRNCTYLHIRVTDTKPHQNVTNLVCDDYVQLCSGGVIGSQGISNALYRDINCLILAWGLEVRSVVSVQRLNPRSVRFYRDLPLGADGWDDSWLDVRNGSGSV